MRERSKMSTLVRMLALTHSVVFAASQAVETEYTDECPVENGFFADAVQCDRYYECKNGKVCCSLYCLVHISKA